MSDTPPINHFLAWYEFRWLAAVGMIAFLVASAVGSPVVMMAGVMMWVGFGVLARRFLRPGGFLSTRFGVDAQLRRDTEERALNGQVSAPGQV